MYLIIDDERTLGCELIARTPQVGQWVLESLHDRIECLCIDFDLGELRTGLDVVRWAIKHKHLPNKVQVVSMNPPGKKAIIAELESAGYIGDGINYEKTRK